MTIASSTKNIITAADKIVAEAANLKTADAASRATALKAVLAASTTIVGCRDSLTVSVGKLEAARAALDTATPVPVPTPTPTPTPVPTPTVPAQPSTGSVFDVTIGPHQQYPHLNDALAVLREINGGGKWPALSKVRMGWEPVDGYYTAAKDAGYIYPRATDEQGGNYPAPTEMYALPAADGSRKLVSLDLEATPYEMLGNGKGWFVAQHHFILRGFDINGGIGKKYERYGNFAALRIEAGSVGDILIEDCRIRGWGTGILGNCRTITVNRTEVYNCGDGTGQTHCIYIGPCKVAKFDRLLSHRANVGHLLKSRADETYITNSRLLDGQEPNRATRVDGDGKVVDNGPGASSFGLNVPQGGVLDIRDTTIHRSKDAANGPAITHGEEIDPKGEFPPDGRAMSITTRNLVILTETPPDTPFGGTLALWNAKGAPIETQGSQFFGKGPRFPRVAAPGGEVDWPGSYVTLTAMPTLDLSSPVFGGK